MKCPTCGHAPTGNGYCTATVATWNGEVDMCGCESPCHDDSAKVPALS